MPDVYIGGRRYRLGANQFKDAGGEAEIYDLGDGRVAKVFKEPDHPDYHQKPNEQKTAKERLRLHQRKLREFPRGLPAHVVTPQELATDSTGTRVLGYVMPFVAGAE